jgi:hypothetical protein
LTVPLANNCLDAEVAPLERDFPVAFGARPRDRERDGLRSTVGGKSTPNHVIVSKWE